jgi:hypothetical protein
LANFPGFIVELPVELDGKLRPFMGQAVRIAFIDGQYRVALWRRHTA